MRTPPMVFVVDDDSDDRNAICAMVRSLRIDCEPFASAEAFLAQYNPARPGCVIADFSYQANAGVALQRELANRKSTLPVIVISASIDVPNTVSAMRAGAETVLRKPLSERELWEAIRNALARDAERRALRAAHEDIRSQFASLTPAEHEILELVVMGLPNKTVAKRLSVSVRTVEDRRRRIMKKLRANSFAKLMEKVFHIKHLDSTAE